MTRQNGPYFDENYLRQGSPTNSTFAESVPRFAAGGNLSALTTQVMLTAGLPLQYGDKVTSLTFISGGTAAGTPTNYWFALYDTSGALLSQSADQTTTAWAADTALTLALASAQTITTPGLYYAAIMVKATTPPTLRGADLGHATVGGAIGLSAKVLAQTSGSALTATAPATIATPTTVATLPYVVAS